jgi:hypothetical protein
VVGEGEMISSRWKLEVMAGGGGSHEGFVGKSEYRRHFVPQQVCGPTANIRGTYLSMGALGERRWTQHSFILKNAVFWDVTPCGSCKNRRFGRA